MVHNGESIPPRLYPLLKHSQHRSHRRILKQVRVLQTNHGLITAFALVSGLGALFVYFATLRILIPGRLVSKRDVHALTSGFTRDVPAGDPHQHSLPPHLMPQRRRPGVFLVGLSMCGGHVVTSAMAQHPDVAVNTRDTKYFTTHYNHTPEWYQSKMPASLSHHITIDVSYSVILNQSALSRVRAYNKSARVVVVICDPVSRLVTKFRERTLNQQSQHSTSHHLKMSGGIKPDSNKNSANKSIRGHILDVDSSAKFNFQDFKSWLSFTEDGKTNLRSDILRSLGDYFPYFSALFKTFPRRRILVVERNRFYQNPRTELTSVYKFLNVHQMGEDSPKAVTSGGICFPLTPGRERCVQDMAQADLLQLQAGDPTFITQLAQFYNSTNQNLFTYLKESYDWL